MINKKFEQLKPKLTPEFLETLRELARCYGWSGDYVEVQSFVERIHSALGINLEADALEPHEEVEEAEAQQLPIMTFDQIVEHMLAGMDEVAKTSWKNVLRDQLIMGHHSTGRAIRNNYRLWEENHPAVGDKHPDDVSMEIMEQVWDRVNGQ